jgi:small ligand-binding sensory domain FIST
MQRFSLAHSSGSDWRTLCTDCCDQLSGFPATANLGFLYVTTALAPQLEEVLATLKTATGIEHWVGSVGIGINCTGQEYYEIPALAVMLGEFASDAFRIVPGTSSSDFERVIMECRPWYLQQRHHWGILHGDPRNPGIAKLITQLAQEIPGAYFVGGLTSSAKDCYSQVADSVTEGGVSGVLFGPKVRLTANLTQGCSPLGPRRKITACDLHVIHRIEDRPALDVLYEDIGEILARDPKRIAGYIFAGLPVSGDSDYLVRNLLGLDLHSRRIAIGDRVRPGQEIMFCSRDGNSARDDLRRMVRDVRRHLPASAKGGVYYSCLGRGRYMFGNNSQELQLIRAELGDIPIVGFFANGEISHNRLYGYTGVLALFS